MPTRPGFTGSTRNDGRPPPDTADYHLLVGLAWLSGAVAAVFLTAVVTGLHRTPDDRAGYVVSWPACIWVAAVATAVCYAAQWAAVRHGGRALRHADEPLTRRRRRDLASEAGYEDLRRSYFGDRRLATPLANTPLLLTIPMLFGGLSGQSTDGPPPGDDGAYLTTVIAGIVFPVVIVLLRALTGRGLTGLAVLAWTPWAWFAQEDALGAAAQAGAGGLAAVLLATVGTIALARRRMSRHGGRSPVS